MLQEGVTYTIGKGSNQTVAGLKRKIGVKFSPTFLCSNQTVAGLKLHNSQIFECGEKGSNQTVAGLKRVC